MWFFCNIFCMEKNIFWVLNSHHPAETYISTSQLIRCAESSLFSCFSVVNKHD